MEEMTAKELDRLADWLKAHGMTPEQVLDCLKYIAGTSAPTVSAPVRASPHSITRRKKAQYR